MWQRVNARNFKNSPDTHYGWNAAVPTYILRGQLNCKMSTEEHERWGAEGEQDEHVGGRKSGARVDEVVFRTLRLIDRNDQCNYIVKKCRLDPWTLPGIASLPSPIRSLVRACPIIVQSLLVTADSGSRASSAHPEGPNPPVRIRASVLTDAAGPDYASDFGRPARRVHHTQSQYPHPSSGYRSR